MAAAIKRTELLKVLERIRDILGDLQQPWALIGGLAVTVQTGAARFTQDVDLAVAVTDDAAAEALIYALCQRGYRVVTAMEQDATGRMSTVRLVPLKASKAPVFVDLLFAASGIEEELVAASEPAEIVPGLLVPVARAGHLVAMKVLSVSDKRRRDMDDLENLLSDIAPRELARAREAITLIEQRGYNRGKALGAILDSLLPVS